MSTLILTFQFSGYRFFREKNPEQGRTEIKKSGSKQKREKDLRSPDSGAEKQTNPEVVRHQEGIDDLRAQLAIIRDELARTRDELDKLRSIVDSLTQENRQGFLNQPVSYGSLARMYILYLLLEPLIKPLAEKITNALGL